MDKRIIQISDIFPIDTKKYFIIHLVTDRIDFHKPNNKYFVNWENKNISLSYIGVGETNNNFYITLAPEIEKDFNELKEVFSQQVQLKFLEVISLY